MRVRPYVLSLLAVLLLWSGIGRAMQVQNATAALQAPPTAAPQALPSTAAINAPVPQGADAYRLPPDKLEKARNLFRTRTLLGFAGTAWSLLQLVLILSLGVAARFRDTAERTTRSRWLQALLFLLMFVLLTTLLDLPLSLYGHHLSLAYGQSVQRWPSWFADQAKGFGLALLFGWPVVMLLFWVIRKAPRSWWFFFWIPAIALTLLGVFLVPYVIDPLFNKFEPLAKSNPALVDQLEKVVSRGGISIPPSRMFLMKASDKVTTLNAYVTGFGASKRVVVWDTSIAKGTPDEISFIFGHEMGHYVLGHIVSGILFSFAVQLVLFFLGYQGVQWLLRRYGERWRIPSQNDWGALVVLMLVLSVASFFSEPIFSAFSRAHEHAADVYGQEAVHGIVPNPQAAAQGAFQVLGENSLDDPTHHPWLEFWSYSHPPIWQRAAFAAAYDPWRDGQQPRYFSR